MTQKEFELGYFPKVDEENMAVKLAEMMETIELGTITSAVKELMAIDRERALLAISKDNSKIKLQFEKTDTIENGLAFVKKEYKKAKENKETSKVKSINELYKNLMKVYQYSYKSKGQEVVAKIKMKQNIGITTEEIFHGLPIIMEILGDTRKNRSGIFDIENVVAIISSAMRIDFEKAATLYEIFNEVLYDTICYEKDGELKTFAIVEFETHEEYETSIGNTPLPLIEKPLDRVKGDDTAGGYHAAKQKGLMMKNSADQFNFDPAPINHLQNQKWKINFDLFNPGEYHEFLVTSQLKKTIKPVDIVIEREKAMLHKFGPEFLENLTDIRINKMTKIINNEATPAITLKEKEYNLAFYSYEKGNIELTRYDSTKKTIVEDAIQKARLINSRINVFEKSDEVYLTWRMDSRGREYAVAFGLNPQSDKYLKGLLSPVI